MLILSGDHIYRMDYAAMLQFHEQHEAVATVACMEVELEAARGENDAPLEGLRSSLEGQLEQRLAAESAVAAAGPTDLGLECPHSNQVQCVWCGTRRGDGVPHEW